MHNQIITYQDVDDTPINFRKLKKTMFNGVDWEDRIFYETRENVHTAHNWLQKKYGDSRYCVTWWATHTSIVMSDKIYTHYRLSI